MPILRPHDKGYDYTQVYWSRWGFLPPVHENAHNTYIIITGETWTGVITSVYMVEGVAPIHLVTSPVSMHQTLTSLNNYWRLIIIIVKFTDHTGYMERSRIYYGENHVPKTSLCSIVWISVTSPWLVIFRGDRMHGSLSARIRGGL